MIVKKIAQIKKKQKNKFSMKLDFIHKNGCKFWEREFKTLIVIE